MKYPRDIFIRNIWITLLILSYAIFTYYFFGGWWNSSLGTLLILFFSFILWRDNFIITTGLRIRRRDVPGVVIASILATLFSYLILRLLANRNGISIEISNWQNYYHDVFYIINEEIVLGSLALYYLIRKAKIGTLNSSVILALLFALIHYIFYRWVFLSNGIIQITTLLSLVLIGLLRNNLIIIFNHIGYSWALHFGWMAIMFGSYHTVSLTGEEVSELDKFNIYLGSTEMLIISAVLSVISTLYLLKRIKDKKVSTIFAYNDKKES